MTTPGEIRLGKLELEIMKVVWEREQATVRDVSEGLPSRHQRAYSTILTMMRKIEGKGYLVHEARDRTYVYRATITRNQVRRSFLADLVERVFDGSAQLVVSGLMDVRSLNRKELAEIRRLIGEKTRESRE